MIEVELKYALSTASRSRLEVSLAAMGAPRHLWNSDVYYDTPTFDLLRQAVFVRVRNQERLEFKFNEQAAPAHIHCTERVFSLTPEPRQAEEMNALFSSFLPDWRGADTVIKTIQQNGLIELARIENHRIEYTSKNLVFCLDQVEGLGNYLEIETRCEEESEIDRAITRVQAFTSGLVALHIGYVELWLQKYHPHAYRQGKYQEERSSEFDAPGGAMQYGENNGKAQASV